jgi:hypothetical protein
MTVGMTDPLTGRTRTFTSTELARLWSTSANHIAVGVTRARRIRQRCHDALA